MDVMNHREEMLYRYVSSSEPYSPSASRTEAELSTAVMNVSVGGECLSFFCACRRSVALFVRTLITTLQSKFE
jgi:hypothetical protein